MTLSDSDRRYETTLENKYLVSLQYFDTKRGCRIDVEITKAPWDIQRFPLIVRDGSLSSNPPVPSGVSPLDFFAQEISPEQEYAGRMQNLDEFIANMPTSTIRRQLNKLRNFS